MATPLEVEQEILARMPGFADPVNANWTTLTKNVGSFLSDKTRVRPALVSLESKMQAELARRLGVAVGLLNTTVAQNQLKANRTPGTKLPPAYQNLLSTVLAAKEQTHGFQLGSKPRAWSSNNQPATLMLVGFVPPTDFRGVIQTGKPFKDPTVPFGHGEFTHRLQWYCMMKVKPAGLPGTETWGKFYEWVGGLAHTVSVIGDKPGFAELGLWDALFDRNRKGGDDANGPYNTASNHDYRSPENLHSHVVKETVTYPLLSAFLKAREDKREASKIRDPDDDVWLKDFLARKMFGVATYQSLYLKDKDKINAIMQKQQLEPGAKETPASFLSSSWWMLFG